MLVLRPPKLWPVGFFEAGRGGFPVLEASERAYAVVLLLIPSSSGHGHRGWGRVTPRRQQVLPPPASPALPGAAAARLTLLGAEAPWPEPLGQQLSCPRACWVMPCTGQSHPQVPPSGEAAGDRGWPRAELGSCRLRAKVASAGGRTPKHLWDFQEGVSEATP